MAKTKITEKMVFALCDRIYMETGKDPRYEDLTTELGCSNSTVKPFFDSWLAEERPARHPLPEKLAETLTSFAQAMWGHALRAGLDAVLPDKQQMEAGFTRCQEQLANAVRIIEEGQEEQARLREQIETLMRQRAELQVQLDMTAATSARCVELEKRVEAIRQDRDAANARASVALGQVAAHERHIQSLLSSMNSKSAERRTARANARTQVAARE